MNRQVLEELIEYKFAPGPLIAVQGLANSYSYENDLELLAGPERAREWLVEAGLLDPAAEVTAGDVTRAVELRETIRDLIHANGDGEPNSDASRRLARMAAEHPARFVVSDEGEVGLDLSPARSVGELVAQTVGIIAEAQTRDEWRRLKICPAEDCRWAFYDSSKNRGGTWCRMEVCGNRSKNRRYRQKS